MTCPERIHSGGTIGLRSGPGCHMRGSDGIRAAHIADYAGRHKEYYHTAQDEGHENQCRRRIHADSLTSTQGRGHPLPLLPLPLTALPAGTIETQGPQGGAASQGTTCSKPSAA